MYVKEEIAAIARRKLGSRRCAGDQMHDRHCDVLAKRQTERGNINSINIMPSVLK